MPEFVHLHNHSHYSLLDAACTPQQLIDAAKADGQKALALTDHGVMFGCYEFYKKAVKAKIKPIIGFEAYMANGSRFEKIAGKAATKKRNYFHLLLLAKDLTGYNNLMKLTSYAHLEGFYYKPRIDRELLEKYHEGIIAASACIAGVLNVHLINGDYSEAKEAAKYYKDLFGEDFYIELQHHNFDEDKIILRDGSKIAKELGIKIVASNDIHYLKKEHAVAHNVLQLIKDVTAANAGNVDIYNLRYRTPEMYFKTQQEMNFLFADFPEAIDNTVEIADKCNVKFEEKLFMPEYPIPAETSSTTLDGYLEELTMKGMKEKYPVVTTEIEERVIFELDVIKNMKFPGYFLIVHDFIKAAEKLGVRVGPGRGSAAGSIVAYALGITNIDPLPYDLLFERFLNPERVSMPDIDIDFCDKKRDLVIDYVKQKYGENSVAQIITFGKLSTRAVLTDVGRVLGVDLQTIKNITSKITVVQGKVTELAKAVELPDLKWVKESDDPKIKELLEYSLLLEDKLRNTSTHAAGVVIAPGDISDFVPLYQQPKTKSQGSELISQYSMNDLEDAGLLKMDFLGLRTLSIIDDTLEMIEKNHNIKIDIDKIDFDDGKTYELLSAGHTLAVFQFESKGMQEYLHQLKPKNLEELTAMNALYRPGPMDNIPDFIDRKYGRKPISYLHPLMEKSLNKTYGIIVYQEQVMQLARDISGFSLGQADILRRAMGKKKIEVMTKLKPAFLDGAQKNGLDEKLALEIFELIEKFAKYGFNKSHSLAYSYLAFQTAWLKTYYTAEFLAANMSAELNDLDKIVQLIEEAKKFGITVLPPDVNKSFATFTVDKNNILFGLAGIKNVGISAVESIITAREEKPFDSFFDFTARVDTKLINKRALEALVCAGAFDSIENNLRKALFIAIEPALEYARSYQEYKNHQTNSLFGGGGEMSLKEPNFEKIEDWCEQERLEKEKDVLKFYISGHPLNRYRPYVESLKTLSLGDKESNLIGEQVRVCGIVTAVRSRYDRKQKPIAFVQFEDFTGSAELIFWSDSYSKFAGYLKDENVLWCMGKSEKDKDLTKIVVEEAIPIEEAARRYAKGFNIWVDLEKTDLAVISQFSKLCTEQGAKSMVIFNVFNKSNNYQARYVAYDINISLKYEAINSVINLFGSKNMKLIV